MNAAQDAKYWRLWGQIRKARPDLDRHDLHIQALGKDKSHKAFTNDDFDKFIALYHSIINPGSLDAQLRQLNQQKTRLIWKITIEQSKLLAVCLAPLAPALAPALAYILQIIRDQFPMRDSRERSDAQTLHAPDALHSQLSTLNPQQLEHLRSTLAARINTLRGERGLTIHDMTTLAGLPCNCRQCNPRRRLVLTAADATGFHHDPQAGDYSNAPF